jgi:uncharacterized protein (DUF2141 family)
MKRICLLCLMLIVAFSFISCSEETQQKGTINGKVTNNGNPINGAYVLLLDSGQLIAANQPVTNGMVTNAQGKYTIYMVEPGKYYYVAAVQDNNGDGQYTPGTDKIGYYGNYQGQTWIPTEISLSSGEVLNDINITALY